MLDTVNLYLATVADAVKKHGVHDRQYIGDWRHGVLGRTPPNEKHASDCVWAAIDRQRAIRDLNERRTTQNTAHETENRARLSPGCAQATMMRCSLAPHQYWPGNRRLMGLGRAHFEFTVFGRE